MYIETADVDVTAPLEYISFNNGSSNFTNPSLFTCERLSMDFQRAKFAHGVL